MIGYEAFTEHHIIFSIKFNLFNDNCAWKFYSIYQMKVRSFEIAILE